MDANESAWHNQQVAMDSPTSYWSGLGKLGPISPSEREEEGFLSGRGGSHVIRGISDAVERMRFLGHDISIWVSSGWLIKTFTVKGDKDSVAMLKRWVEWRGH